ncbi:MAG: cytochrome c oxidase assembly protein [Alphaproteobacteria bacterium]|nr:cytochrome c oxidase assembly protein [Alphaproteobacteria bacterium]MBV9902224.1 cytochrome c oxidase assembly protein [Alphaproteobacteria bacterium]
MSVVARRNQRTGVLMALLVLFMVGLAYASVPLYRMFCQVTGFDGTTQRAEGKDAPGPVAGKSVSVRFDANTALTLPWKFQPERTTETVTIGERELAIFRAKNLSARPITGRATFNVSPTQAGKYFTKIQCFCFTEQTLKPGEEVRMPVIFYVDPKFAKDPDTADITEITLSYTFYPVDEAEGRS